MANQDHSLLQDFAAVATPKTGQDIIFYVIQDYSISYCISHNANENGMQQYNRANLKVSGNVIKVNKDLPVIAAVACCNPKGCSDGGRGDDEVCLYLVDPNSFCVKELKRSGLPNNNTWEYGREFNSKNLDIFKKSGLTANVVLTREGGHQLKVYFQKMEGQLSVAYRVLGYNDWSQRPGVTN